MEITTEIITSFRAAYPGFEDVTKWPDDTLEMALCEGDAETGGCGWGVFEDVCSNFKRRGMFLYAAHYLAVTYPNGAGDGGTMNGGAQWAQSGKTVGDESVTFNNGNLSNAGVGDSWLASSQFGQQWIRLRRRAGMGARAV